jgi:two-component system, OmpR family, sensor histidine kinase ChvG
VIPISPKLRTSLPSDTAGAKPAPTQADSWSQAARWIGASLTLKLVALVGIFVALPIVLYGQFESADRQMQELVIRAIQDRSTLIARALAPVLSRREPLSQAEINTELAKYVSDGTMLKLLRQPTGAPYGEGFYFVGSAPQIAAEQVDGELDELMRRGVLRHVTDACTLDSSNEIRYRPPGGRVELLTSIIPIKDPRGCWVLLSTHATSEFLNTSIGRPYWETREVLLAAGIYFVLAVLVFLIAFGIRRSLRRFRSVAYEIGQGRIGDYAFTARNIVPELSGVALTFDKLVLDLRHAADQIRQSAEENAHSIKTPLAAIKSALKPIRHACPADDLRAQRALDIIDHCIDRLYAMITAAQRLDNSTADLISAPRKPTNLTQLVADATLNFREVMASRDIRLIRRLDDDVMVRAASGVLEVVMQNILDNAIGFSLDGGTITITLTKSNETVDLQIEDEGPGIAPDKIGRVFDRNFSSRPRDGAAAPQRSDNAGLGLWIVQRNVEALGGQVVARNRATGGLMIAVTLPRSHG